MDVVALRHVAFEDLGTIEPLLHERGHKVRYIDVPTADLESIDPAAGDLLVVLGGPISVYETASYPFLAPEIALIERRLAVARPTLGICLGAQLLARALGARVYAAPAKEIGWAPVTLAADGRASALKALGADSVPVFHWHGDTFDLPADAKLLASTELCRNQAFSFGASALALQFHCEVTARALETWYVGHYAEIAATPGLNVRSLRDEAHRWSPVMEPSGRAMFSAWLASVGL
jgi:GMP synthase (glutamine-hydrolysing)